MKHIILYSLLLLCGIYISQTSNLSSYQELIHAATFICLAYIMIEVGLSFNLDKNNLKSYKKDYLTAAISAELPWVFCSLYFLFILQANWKEALLIGRFAAPTSAGVLLVMLSAAGLGAKWIFNKVKVLAIFDDLETVFFMIPFQMILMGFKPECFFTISIITLLLFFAYKWIHQLNWKTTKIRLIFYGAGIFLISHFVEETTRIHLEVLVPAFALGCILVNSKNIFPPSRWEIRLDSSVKCLFMLLVGISIPKLNGSPFSPEILIHVLVITLIINIGKCVPMLFYKTEATLRERLALSIAMFPRGEVGAGVLMVALGYGFGGSLATIAGLSLALNLILTGAFIMIVKVLSNQGPAKLSQIRKA